MHDLKMTDKDNWVLENDGLEVTVLRIAKDNVYSLTILCAA